MANLIAGKRVVTELIQSDFTAENIVTEIERLLPDGPPRESMIQELHAIRTLLATGKPDSGGAIERVASITLNMIRAASPERLEQSVRS
jgi:lipid-A-disaccharide synthase